MPKLKQLYTMKKETKQYFLYSATQSMSIAFLGLTISRWDVMTTTKAQIIASLGVLCLIASYFIFKKYMIGRMAKPGPDSSKFKQLMASKPPLIWLLSTLIGIIFFVLVTYLIN